MLNFLWINLDWVGMAFLFLGFYRTAKKKIDSWIWLSIGCSLLGIFGLVRGAYGLGIGEIAFLVVNVYGYISWKKKEN